jgi:hypothetical protein
MYAKYGRPRQRFRRPRPSHKNRLQILMMKYEALPDTPSKIRFVQGCLEDSNLMVAILLQSGT